MKILFFIHSLRGCGAERVASILLNHFCEKHDTFVAVNRYTPPFYHTDNRIHIIINQTKSKLKIASRLPLFIKMANTIRNIKPDIVISFLVTNNNNALIANAFCRRKIIISERIALTHEPSLKHRFLRKILYPTANKIVFVTNEDRINFGWPQKSLSIYNPAMLEPYTDYNNRPKKIVAIGPNKRWHQKGFDILMRAWEQISQQNTDWSLEIYGRISDVPLPDFLNQKQERVTWMGWRDNIAEVLRTKSIFILASRFEGCPNSLIEAMSQGCACVVTDCAGGAKEMIDDGINGLIARSEDVVDISTKLQMLINDENLRLKLSYGATEKIKQFDKNAFFAQWDNLLEEVVRR
ncbi:MAG: glycosyltransferase [Salinivirgaceae bacterium]|nr:glycosyltransferase [Salinivirgaceae bacterium]